MHGQQNIKTHFFCFGDAQTNNCISAKIFILLTYVEIITIHLFGTRHNVLCVKARKKYGPIPGKIKYFFFSSKNTEPRALPASYLTRIGHSYKGDKAAGS